MRQVLFYSFLLIAGITCSQFFNLSPIHYFLHAATMVCLAYIMIEVGLEFTLDKKNIKSYGVDYLVAATAAAFPWIFCAIYFGVALKTNWKEALLIARFAAPTSAGVLFTLLAAAGLGTTWLFRKARILAIFDDLDTVLLMIPLQMMMVGFKAELLVVVGIIIILLGVAYRWLHVLRLPIHKTGLLGYSFVIVILCQLLERAFHVHLEVLLPAFALGCLLYNPHDPALIEEHQHEHAFLEPEDKRQLVLDRMIKGLFMFLVGSSLPKIELGQVVLSTAIWHVIMLTLLSNFGKCFPMLCYKKESTLRERFALSIAMFPRGEVGAGVLLISAGYGLSGLAIGLAGLSLALNLLLTGVFISGVLWLISPKPEKKIISFKE